MIITDLSNKTEMLIDCNNISISRTLGGAQTIEFVAIRTDNNYGYDLVQNDSLIKGINETFVIKDIDETPYSKRVIALNEFFECNDDYVGELWPDGLYTIQESLQLAFSTSDWGYVIADTYPQRAKLEEFGNDNPVSMLNKITAAFNSEYEIDSINKRVIIKRRIGYDTDYQIRDKYNITAISRGADSKNVKTAVEVFYNLDEFGKYNNSVIYYSPNRNKYRKTKWRAPIYSESIVTEAQAIATARLVLQDTPDITFSVEFSTLQDMGYESDDIQLGNGVFLIDERLGIKSTARIVNIVEFYKQVNGRLVKDRDRSPVVTISNIQNTVSKSLVQQQKQSAEIERSVVKQKVIYNGCTISKEDGFKAVAENGVETIMNATEGISISRDGELKFFVDAVNDELTMDGRLNVTSGQTLVMEAFKDTAGGLLRLYDKDGLLNVELGSNVDDTFKTGGSFTLYNDGNTKADARIEFEIKRSNDAGAGYFRSSDGTDRVSIEAISAQGEPRVSLTKVAYNGGTVINPGDIMLYNFSTPNNDIYTTITDEEIVINTIPVKENIMLLWEAIDELWDYINNM